MRLHAHSIEAAVADPGCRPRLAAMVSPRVVPSHATAEARSHGSISAQSEDPAQAGHKLPRKDTLIYHMVNLGVLCSKTPSPLAACHRRTS